MSSFLPLDDTPSVLDVLNPGERVLWEGTCLSRRGRQAKSFPIARPLNYLLPPGILIAVVVIIADLRSSTDSWWPWLLVGLLALVVAALLWPTIQGRLRDSTMYCRKQTRYAITTQRAIVLRNCQTKRRLQSLPWQIVEDVRTAGMRLDGRGTVQFVSWDPITKREIWPMRFFMVGRAAQVVEQAIAARDATRG